MYKQIQSQFFIIAFLLYLHSGTASATYYVIQADFKQYPGSATHIVVSDQYCMDSTDDNIKLDKGGFAVINLDTNGSIFSKCGWVHSSATYQALNDKNEVKVEFEFYKPLSEDPEIELKTPGLESICSVSGPTSQNTENFYIYCNEIP